MASRLASSTFVGTASRRRCSHEMLPLLGIRVSLPISLTPHAIRSRETEKIGEKLALELVNGGGGEDE